MSEVIFSNKHQVKKQYLMTQIKCLPLFQYKLITFTFYLKPSFHSGTAEIFRSGEWATEWSQMRQKSELKVLLLLCTSTVPPSGAPQLLQYLHCPTWKVEESESFCFFIAISWFPKKKLHLVKKRKKKEEHFFVKCQQKE